MVYDYIIRNGTVIDFQRNQFYKKDIYMIKGRIVEGEPSADAGEIIDAEGKYVLPGLIDMHAHYFYGGNNLGINADILCPAQGITTSIDAGSTGIMNFDAFYRNGLIDSITEIKAYINLIPEGVKAGYKRGECCDPDDMDCEQIIGFFKKYPNVIKGLKLRIAEETTKGFGLRPLEKAVQIAEKIRWEGYPCVLAVHCANLPEDAPISGILQLLKPGDSYTHLYQNLGETIFDQDRKVRKELQDARERGVLFETGNGSIHWSIPNLTDAYKDRFFPDIISSDAVLQFIWKKPSFGLLHAMNTSLLCGMDELSIMKAVTYAPARALDLTDEIGTLENGTRADLAILDILPCKQEFFDRFGNSKQSERVFVPLMTLREGKPVFRQSFF